MKQFTILAAICLALTLTGNATADEMKLYTPGVIEWKSGPKSLPAGAQMAVLEGDPAAEGPFTLRFKFPDGYKVMPHIHPKTERVTVISGTLNLGMGDTFDASATRALPAGSHGHWPAGMKHFAWANGETIIQLHGIGPWQITYLNPADDPRNVSP